MNTDNNAIKKTELVINALDYAQTHELDINSKEDVKKIIEALDPEHTSDKEIEELMMLLQNTNTFMQMTAKKKQSEEPKLPN